MQKEKDEIHHKQRKGVMILGHWHGMLEENIVYCLIRNANNNTNNGDHQAHLRWNQWVMTMKLRENALGIHILSMHGAQTSAATLQTQQSGSHGNVFILV